MLIGLLLFAGYLSPAAATDRPVLLYEFADRADPPASVIKEQSEVGDGVELVIENPKSVESKGGGLVLRGKTKIASRSAPVKLIGAVKRSNALSIEVWLTPANRTQSGPARIVTLSTDASHRNFTLGQDKDRFDVRLRTTKTSENGLPSLASPKGSATTELTHVVFTRARGGATRIYVNGKPVAESKAQGSFANWSDGAPLALGDELTGSRPWSGRLHRVALYATALTPHDVQTHFNRGVESLPEFDVRPGMSLAESRFEHQVAPLLAKHCLECHDVSSASGDLVLDRKQTAFADAIVPGKADESPLWISVAEDSMPHNRAPLSQAEKDLLQQWIDSGAAWSLDWIDPADYVHDATQSENYVRRLTIEEYIRSVRVAVDVDVSHQARQSLPPDLRADGFNNTAYNLTVDLGHVEAYNRLAKAIVSEMDVARFAKRFWGKPRLTDKDMRGLIENMGTWILRGPLDDSEVDFFRGISTTVAAAGGGYREAVAATIEAMLQSPRFLYRIENQTPDGQTDFLDDYQLASRLSYMVWGSPPDQALMDAASDGRLGDTDVVLDHVRRMLDDPRAITRSKDFVTQWLNLGHLASLQPDGKRFPDWDAELASQMREETLRFFEHVVWEQRRPLAELLDAQVTFLTPDLAKHYGMKPLNQAPSKGFQRYDLAGINERGGLLTQGSLLTIGGDDASMVTRGLFVLHELLRGVVNDPPPCVDTTPQPTKAGVSARTISEARIKNEACGGCHVRFEPLAFGLERYDGLGTYHERDEHGNALRGEGNVLFPGQADAVEFQDSGELMKLLAASDRVQETLVWKLAQFALGRPLTANDSKSIREIHQRAKQKGATYQTILTEIATSPLVLP